MTTAQIEQAIMGRMVAEEAKDMSSAEIVRTLQNCVSGHRLIPIAQRMASEGVLLDAYMKTGEVTRVN